MIAGFYFVVMINNIKLLDSLMLVNDKQKLW